MKNGAELGVSLNAEPATKFAGIPKIFIVAGSIINNDALSYAKKEGGLMVLKLADTN